MSGERGVETRGAPGDVAGAADMLEICMLCGEAKDDEEGDAIKARKKIAENDQKGAINDCIINCLRLKPQ